MEVLQIDRTDRRLRGFAIIQIRNCAVASGRFWSFPGSVAVNPAVNWVVCQFEID